MAYETVFLGYRGMLCGMGSNQAHGRIKTSKPAESVADGHLLFTKESNGQSATDLLGLRQLVRVSSDIKRS